MTPIPTDWALHTTCIAADFVHRLFTCHVGDRQPSVLPPLALDVPTMLACQQLAQVLTDAYANPIQLDLDMIRYNEALDKRSTGRNTKHEDALLQKFPCSSQQLLEKPSVFMDSGGRIILWYLPDAISPWIQVRLCIVTCGSTIYTNPTGRDGSSHGRDGLPPENKHHQWTRVQLENILWSFSHEQLPPANPRMHQHSPLLVPARLRGMTCFFMRNADTHSEVSALWFPPHQWFHPGGVGYAEGGRWSKGHNINAVISTPGLGSSSGDAPRVVLGFGHHTDETRLMGYGK
ncbi:uncharacterized protein EDB91DRAFT_1254281 [Suillus paluster]|uniref:uncharacterized protein n=1 Tax=Suillus paluster TaxID=48578 RepID=UPI001B866AA6|nr:uncharacterized protein EDB91DRAFT_1254281 [Suillus paluster]KAG1726507.1 hypothetical protein EDB91DRAFT_1254281 [Suillus paluster]